MTCATRLCRSTPRVRARSCSASAAWWPGGKEPGCIHGRRRGHDHVQQQRRGQPVHRHPLGSLGARRSHARPGDQSLHRGQPRHGYRTNRSPTGQHLAVCALDDHLLLAWPEPGCVGHHQARHHRPRHPDPGWQLTVSRSWHNPSGRAVPGHRRYIHVQPARGWPGRTDEAGASRLEPGDDQVGDDDHRQPERA